MGETGWWMLRPFIWYSNIFLEYCRSFRRSLRSALAKLVEGFKLDFDFEYAPLAMASSHERFTSLDWTTNNRGRRCSIWYIYPKRRIYMDDSGWITIQQMVALCKMLRMDVAKPTWFSRSFGNQEAQDPDLFIDGEHPIISMAISGT